MLEHRSGRSDEMHLLKNSTSPHFVLLASAPSDASAPRC